MRDVVLIAVAALIGFVLGSTLSSTAASYWIRTNGCRECRRRWAALLGHDRKEEA
jgi:hypothetical protein